LGLVKAGRVYDVSSVLDDLPRYAWPFPPGDLVIAHLAEIAAKIRDAPLPATSYGVDEVAWCSPVANPSKIVAAPVNYRLHLEESEADPEIHGNRAVLRIGTAGLFLKATSALVGPAEGIALHFPDRRTDHEVELVAVIGKTCKNVAEADALDVVAGYCIGLDVTVRGPEDRSFRKSLDSYAVLGPWLTLAGDVPDPDNLELELRVNGETRQRANTSLLIFGVKKLIAWASEWYTLYPGDVLFTGTPEGVGPIAPGDVLDASIEGLGAMRVSVRSA
jgi:2-keto-4-pentenoate hydratase/2-oxohepta-3-ene-1,7-dioic acid hydratase in catechol pathway